MQVKNDDVFFTSMGIEMHKLETWVGQKPDPMHLMLLLKPVTKEFPNQISSNIVAVPHIVMLQKIMILKIFKNLGQVQKK
jgi:hypothetical protein